MGTMRYLFYFMLFMTSSHLVSGAHSRKRVVVTRERTVYDRVITEFTPDGRLSQVEYGLEAASKGSTIIVAKVGDSGLCWLVQGSSFGKVHRLDHHLWLITAGLSGDARIFAKQLRRYCQQHRLQYGEPPSIAQVARWAGEWQHQLTLSGGIRPLGCTAVVLGVDPTRVENELGKPQVFQTDPGGVVEDVTSFCVVGKNRDALVKPIGSLLETRSKKETTDDLQEAATELAQVALGKLDNPKTVDLWTVEPRIGKRGGMETTCYENISKESIAKVLKDAKSK